MKLKIEIDIFDHPKYCQNPLKPFQRCNHLFKQFGICGVFTINGFVSVLKRIDGTWEKCDECKKKYDHKNPISHQCKNEYMIENPDSISIMDLFICRICGETRPI